ncbi:uncharacterized protein V6R79_006035 [Siganus canaliculatus]
MGILVLDDPAVVSELRVVLLGNSWSLRSSVGNFILETTKFKSDEDAKWCQRENGQIKEKKVVVINTPDQMLDPNISEVNLIEIIGSCKGLCDPGPHVFLLVLQPEDFTEGDNQRLCRVLGHFSDQSFKHSLVLLSASREESPGFREHPPLKDLIQKCRSRCLWQKNLELSELLTRFDQNVRKNNGEHVNYERYSAADQRSPEQKETQTSFIRPWSSAVSSRFKTISGYWPLPQNTPWTQASGLRIVLLGRSEDKQTKLAKFITRDQSSHYMRPSKINQTKSSSAVSGEWRGKPVTVVKTPNFFTLSLETLMKEVRSCVSLCRPGPNVLLLLVKPSDFTEENGKTLKFILSLFGPDALKFSMVVLTHDDEMSQTVKQLLQDCEGRSYRMSVDDHTLLMEMTEKTASKYERAYLTLTEETTGPECEDLRPSLNLVLCGRRAAGKTSAAKAMLGQRDLQSVSRSSLCVRSEGQVFGWWLSLVELPALYGKPVDTVMEEAFRCMSLCGPEGVHAFVLVLPVGQLTDEDDGELETIQKTFGSKVSDFTTILFTVDSDPTDPAVLDFIRKNNDIQKFLQSCGGRHVVVNIRNKQQIPELLDMVETMRMRRPGDKPWSYTSETFLDAQKEKIVQQEKLIVRLQRELKGASCFGRKAEKFTIILLTRGDELEETPIDKYIEKECDASFKKLISGCGGRFHVFNNRDEQNRSQVSELITKIDAMVKENGGSCFTNEMLQEAEAAIRKETEKILKEKEEEMKREKEELEKKYEEEMEEMRRRTEEQRVEIENERKLREKQLEEMKENIKREREQRQKEQETREEENRKRKQQEEYERQEWEEKVKDLEEKFKYESETKEKIYRKLEENRERLLMEQENWEKTQREWREKRQQEDEQRREEEQEKLRKLQLEYDKERDDYEKKREEDEKEKQSIREEQRAEIEKERKLREKQLEILKENINKEQEERKKEEKVREEVNRRREEEEERKRQEWKQRLETMEQRIKSESESKEHINKELQKTREEMEKEKENWEKQQEEFEEQRKREDEQRRKEEQGKLRKLQEEYDKEREDYRKKREEEERIRREEEEKKQKELEQKYETTLEEAKKTHEEEARKQAEEFNKFKEKHNKEFTAQRERYEKALKDKEEQYDILKALSDRKELELMRKHQHEICNLVKHVTRNKQSLSKIQELMKKHDKEMIEKEEKGMNEEEKKHLEEKHEAEIIELIPEIMKHVDTSSCSIL